MSQEEFIVMLQTNFDPEAQDLQSLLSFVGTIKDEKVSEFKDNRVTQKVTAREGVALSKNVGVINPWRLAPFRTFTDISQPFSPFILRLRGGGEEKPPELALICADGGAWKDAARASIREKIEADLAGMTDEKIKIVLLA